MKNPIKPYVTDRGGIVILNGPFPVKEAHLIAKKIEESYAAHKDLLHLAQYVSRADFKYGFNRKQARHLALKALAHFQKKENHENETLTTKGQPRKGGEERSL